MLLEANVGLSVDSLAEPILGLLRLLWRGFAETGKVDCQYSPLDLQAALRKQCPDTPAGVCEAIVSSWFRNEVRRSERISFSTIAACLGTSANDFRDLSYFAIRSIRKRHGIGISSSTAHDLHNLTAATSRLIDRFPVGSIPYVSELGPALAGALVGDNSGTRVTRAYVRTCQVLDLAEPEEGGLVKLRREVADPAFLISHLFGMPTSIPGFDDLFGGGGLMLADDAATGSAGDESRIGGRAVVCLGPFGTGKTLLGLQFAREVALKGGVAWVVTLEQTAQECLYALESLGIPAEHSSFTLVGGSLKDFFVALGNPPLNRGALALLRPTEEAQSYAEFLETLRSSLSLMSKYPLRLLVIDPVNALFHPKEDQRGIRRLTRQLIEAAKRAQVNIWFNTDVSSRVSRSGFEENVADTVIHLDSKTTLGQQRRTIQVIKSRFQAEQSGRHGLAIEPRGGIHIYPTSAVLASKLAGCDDWNRERTISLGIYGLDRLFGSDHLRCGDVVAFAGPGKGKTLLGVQFLLGNGEDGLGGSVFISDYAALRIERFLTTMPSALMQKRAAEVEMCSIPTGFVDPGKILEIVKSAFEKANSRFGFVSRVLVSNLGRWEQEMPFLHSDATFGMALVELLRAFGGASIVVCGDTLVRGSRLVDTMFDLSDFMLQFERRERQGHLTTLLTAVKTRHMQHAREAFELQTSGTELRVRPAPPFRQLGSGELKPVPISLFLHAETQNHREQNQRMIEGLRAIISPAAAIQDQSRRFDPSLLAISEFSAVDELQVFQIDEFQLPTTRSCSEPPDILFSFNAKLHSQLLDGRLPELCTAVKLPDSDRLIAVPFYANLSFFAVHSKRAMAAWDELGAPGWPDQWGQLASYCVKWEEQHPEDDNPELAFFACPVYERSVETLNCLFFEILQTIRPATDADKDNIALWLESPEALKALAILRILCRRSYLWQRKHRGKEEENRAISRAVITRHWYNTLNQELSEHSGEQLDVEVKPLFGDISTAGEWFLAIPAHSASPEIGLRLIEYLTMSNRETDRVELGVGLPTRTKYYKSKDASISRYFNFSRAEVHALMKKALRRSEFREYQRLSRTISSHIEWALEIVAVNEKEAEAELKRNMQALVENAKFVLSTGVLSSVGTRSPVC